MTICGYHPKMGEGIGRFAEGLSAALQNKAQRNGLAIADQLAQEKFEINALSNYLEGKLAAHCDGREVNAARGLLGLVYLCRYLMRDLVDIRDIQSNLPEFIRKNGDRLIGILETFEAEFERVHDKPADQLARAWSAVTQLDLG